MAFPKAWEREAWAVCPDCGYKLRTQDQHVCNGMIYWLGFRIYAKELRDDAC